MISQSEENYLKAIYKCTPRPAAGHALVPAPIDATATGTPTDTPPPAATTNDIAAELGARAASVTDMLKKLAEKGYAQHKRYQGVRLTETGERMALSIIRKHRLWEVFLVDKLRFGWDEVHEVAEQLEHIHSEKLERALDKFLGFPTIDPHGDPIPDAHGVLRSQTQTTLAALPTALRGSITGVADHSPAFLRHLSELNLSLGRSFVIAHIAEFDGSVTLEMADGQRVQLSAETARHLLVTPHQP